MTFIASRENPRVRRWRELTLDARERRRARSALIEGPHLVSACLDSGTAVKVLLLSKTGSERTELAALARRSGTSPVVLADAVFRAIVDAKTPAGIAAEVALPEMRPALKTSTGCVFLEGIQEAGNVGAILRSAAAFGIRDAVLGRGCADAWSPKVLRAAAGAHFSMLLTEGADLTAALGEFGGRIICTVPRGGLPLADAGLCGRIGWLLGAEGRGVSDALAERASLKITIPMAGGAESLNVAAAAAICFYEFSRRGARA
jgi:TrmH family RNA methyltransferase